MSRMSKNNNRESLAFQPIAMSFDEKLRRYRAIFDSIDGNRSGTLDPEELKQAVVALGLDESRVSDVFGVSGDSSLNFEDFVAAMEAYEQNLSNELAAEEEDESDDDSMEGADDRPQLDDETAKIYRRLFNELDVKKKDKLTAEDLHNYIRNLSLREASMSSEELNFYFALVEEADSSPDGFIDIEGFASVANGHQDFINSYKQRKATNSLVPGFKSRLSHLQSNYTSGGSTTRFDGNEMSLLRQVFDEFDQKKCGRVTDTDVTEMMNRVGRVPTEEESEFLFELLQIVGEEGFTFEEFVELMYDGPAGLIEVGKNVNAWRPAGKGGKQPVKAVGLVRANVSRIGMRPIEREEGKATVSSEFAGLEKIQGQTGADMGRGADNFGAGYSFQPKSRNSERQVPVYPVRSISTAQPITEQSQPVINASALLTPLEYLRYQAVFNALDLDKDGRVSVAEMLSSTKLVTGRQPDEMELNEFIKEADMNGNGTMEFEEFVLIMQKTKRSLGRVTVPNSEFAQAAAKRKMAKFRMVFESFDSNRDGMISPEELTGTLKGLGKNSDETAVRNIFSTYDKNRSGGLEFEEFVQLMDHLVARELNL